jgi:UDP-3-O-[3-hydroxymyristoyl] glucosamine N-acyltransferase
MQITAAQLAEMTKGTLIGDPEVLVSRPMRIEEAQSGDFAFLDNPKYEHFAYSTKASVLMVHEDFVPQQAVHSTLLLVKDVRVTLAALLAKFSETPQRTQVGEISPQAYVHPLAQIGAGSSVGHFAVVEEGAVIGNHCVIYPQVYIGRNARIGDGTILYPGVKVQYDCVVGEDCTLHANAVIGGDGFGFAPQEDASWKKVPQVGNVIIEDQVEIGANTCIDRASLGSTMIRKGAKLDNLIHIAHNVEIGENTVIAAQVGVAGSTKIGAHCQIGGQVGFAGHLTIADHTKIQAQSGLASSVKKPGTALFGSPAIDYGDFVRSYVVFKQLPELSKKVREIEREIAQEKA